MNTALIGHTGFVGSNLDRQYRFTDRFNSSNIGDIAGREFDAVYCAGNQSKKWWANQRPDEDLAGIRKLIEPLGSVRAKTFVLISTVDVYATPIGVDERTEIADGGLQPYGRNRLLLERFVAERFENSLIVRLPGLFGDGLKKNVIFDLMYDNGLENIALGGVFQYYFLDYLREDIERCLDAGLKVVNFVTEPTSTSEIVDRFFHGKEIGAKAASAGRYDIRTVHSSLWGRNDGYLRDKAAVLNDLGIFIERAKTAVV